MKFYIIICYLFILPVIAFSQESTTSTIMPLKTDNGFSIGFSGGGNSTTGKLTWYPKSNTIPYNSEIGYDYGLIVRLKLKGGVFFYSGLNYEMQSYKISAIEGGLMTPAGYALIPASQGFPESSVITFTYTYNNYYLSIPLMAGYAIAKKKWEFTVGLGIEYYYNFKNKETEVFVPTGQTEQFVFAGGQGIGTNNGYVWSRWGAFGLVSAGINYKISRRFSLSCIPEFKFTDPFAESPPWESVSYFVSQHTFSIDFGVNYHFLNRYIGGDFQGKSKKWEKFALGFNVIPNYIMNNFSTLPHFGWSYKANPKFSFSYAFSAQYDLTSHIKLESGIAVDNFNYLYITTNTLIGLPLVANYFIPFGKNQHSSVFIGGGFHFDYPTNIGLLYTPAHPFILPLAIGKCGYRLQFVENYYMDAAIGYEHSFPNIQSSSGTINPEHTGGIQMVGLPNYMFGTIGVGYKF